jgi:hypothetical protein
MGGGMIEIAEEDDLTDEEGDNLSFIGTHSPAWIRIPVHQMMVLLRGGMSIFALFVVYLGGRSKHRRFNDRTIDAVNALIFFSLKTALLIRAVFIFLFPLSSLASSTKYFLPGFIPILFPNLRRLL